MHAARSPQEARFWCKAGGVSIFLCHSRPCRISQVVAHPHFTKLLAMEAARSENGPKIDHPPRPGHLHAIHIARNPQEAQIWCKTGDVSIFLYHSRPCQISQVVAHPHFAKLLAMETARGQNSQIIGDHPHPAISTQCMLPRGPTRLKLVRGW